MTPNRIAIALFSLIVAPSLALTADAPRPPNIVMIISDDQGWGDYSFMGHPHIRTPHLDRLASQSLTFPRGYVPSSLCCPSLAAMITGLYPHQNKITSNDPPAPPGKKPAELRKDPAYRAARQTMIGFIDQVPTLPRLLAPKGYVSFQTGKWWQGNYSHGGFTDGMSKGDPDQGGRHGDEGLKIGRVTMQPIFDFIGKAQQDGKPFFLWYAPMMPHQPHNPPERFLKHYKDKAPTLPIAKYWGMVEWFDETCGQLLDHLDQKGLADNTIVLFLTDNGWIQDPNANRYAARSKQSPYEGGIRTPILLRWPARVKPRKSEQLALSIDFAPTLLAAVGLKATADMQGMNLLDDTALTKRKAIFGACFTHDAVDIQRPGRSLRWRWMIEGEWKLILPSPQNGPNGSVQLFNLARDPEEKTDLAAKELQRVERMTRQIEEWWPGKP